MVKELWTYIKQRKSIYIVITIALIIDYWIVIWPTRIVQQIIDYIASGTLTQPLLMGQLFFLLAISLIAYLAIYVWMKYLFSESARFHYRLRVRLFDKMIRMRIPFYEKFRSGDMMTRFTSDLEAIMDMIGYGAMSLFISVATIVFTIPAMLSMSWQIAIASIIPMAIATVIVYYIGVYLEKHVEASRDAVANLSNEVLEVVEGIRVTRAYGNKALGAQRFAHKAAALRKKANQIMVLQALYGRVANIATSLSTVAVIIMGGYFIQTGQVSLGQVVALQLYALILVEPMWVLSDLVLVYKTAKVSYGKVSEIMTTSDEMEVDGVDHLLIPETIVFKNYSFKYANSEHLVLNQINLSLKKGQTLGVVGKTGSGKTSFIRQFLRQYPVGEGQFLINNRPVQTYRRSTVEGQLGYVPQEHILFSRSVHQNILVGKDEADIIEVATAIQAASFTEDVERMADGMDTLVGEKGVSISGGQKQRISIARAFIKDPEILILDDSLSAVDAKTERRIIENIQRIRQGKTNIIVTHRLSSVMHADWIIVLEDGRISEEGTAQSLIDKKGWFYEQYERQQMEEA